MNKHHRLALRVSVAINGVLSGAARSMMGVDLPKVAWDRCRHLTRQIQKTSRHGWHRAARQLQDQFRCALTDLRRQTDQVAGQLDAPDSSHATATPHDIYRDLITLHDEFDQVDICPRKHTISVVTGPIVLENIALGPFEVKLNWEELGQYQAYSVVALDPNPAVSSSDTTHPHVQDGSLCEGEGRVPIRHALRQGRLLDFFVMVRQILQTYNSSSAYVSLDEWQGIECHDCGRLVAADDRDTCELCEVDICNDCSTGCRACDRRCCGECIDSCSGCEEYFCSQCLGHCAGCQQPFCEECLTDEKCPACHEAENSENDFPEDETVPADTPVHTVRLGQTTVPA